MVEPRSSGADVARVLHELRAVAEWDEVLAGRPWSELVHAWDRRDNRTPRALLHDRLLAVGGHLSPPVAGTAPLDPLRAWRRFSQAHFTGRTGPLLAMMGSTGAGPEGGGAGPDDRVVTIDWEGYARWALGQLLDQGTIADPGATAWLRAAVATFAYLECLVFWENSGEYETVLAIAGAIAELAEVDPPDPGGADRVVAAVATLAGSLADQFDLEQAIGSGCPASMRAAAGASLRDVAEGGRQLGALWRGLHADGSTVDPDLRGLVALLLHDVELTYPYHELIVDQVAPASAAFITNLVDRADDAAVAARLLEAIEGCRRYEHSSAGVQAVFGSEARAHRNALQSAHAVVAGRHPSVAVTQGEVVYLFPFGLPVHGAGTDRVRQKMRQHFEGDPDPQLREQVSLAGCRVVLDDTPQTDAWLETPGTEDLDYVGVRLLFADHELMLRRSDGTLVRDLGIEVRLGGLGNHYVRVSMTTASACSTDGGPWAPGTQGWTPHEIDQLVRRGNIDCGTEEIWLRPRPSDSAASAEVDLAPVGARFERLIELAGAVVLDLVTIAQQLEARSAGPEGEGDAPPEDAPGNTDYPPDTPDTVDQFLRRHAHVLVVASSAEARAAEGSTALERAEDLLPVVGAQTLLTGQRPFSQSPLEWTRFPQPDRHDALFALMGRRIRGELVTCSGETTLVFAPTLPHWQLMETTELIEFASSLTGVSSRRHAWLRHNIVAADRSSSRVERELGAPEVAAAPTAATGRTPVPVDDPLTSALDTLRQVQKDLDECLSHVQGLLDHASTFRHSRDQQSRELMSYLQLRNGVGDIQEGLAQTIGATAAQQRLLRSSIERVADDLGKRTDDRREFNRIKRDQPVQRALTVVAVLSLIDLVWWTADSWTNYPRPWTGVWAVELAGLLALAAFAWQKVRAKEEDELSDWTSDGVAARSAPPDRGRGATAGGRRGRLRRPR